MKLEGGEEQNWRNHTHFFGVAAKAMRHILVDCVRAKHSRRCGGWQQQVSFAEDDVIPPLVLKKLSRLMMP